ncbi:MAG: helix-turn-helix transcriptional regulator [Lachnospiraceae bacterium]|nr:helix-turn-helix transcriptional regulator [Lachnospiraceae bacterium]
MQAGDYLRRHTATISGIGQLAAACHVSQEHLTRCFKKEIGQTPLQYLTRLRLENALFYLLNTDDSIGLIAKNCGFLNGNYFAKVFRRYLNCSPEEYRRRNRC